MSSPSDPQDHSGHHRSPRSIAGDDTADVGSSPIALQPVAFAATDIVAGGAPLVPGNGGSGTVVFDSLGDELDDFWQPGADAADAQSFSTGAGSAVLSVVGLSLQDDTPGDSGQITVQLYSDSDTSPGNLLATLGTISDASLSSSFTTVDLTVTGAPTLSADTRYWIELTATTVNPEWGSTFSTSGTGVSAGFMDVDGFLGPDGGGLVGETFLMSVTTEAPPACFAAGTRIRTARGDVAVEALRPGDQVIAARDGRLAPVRWIGRRRLAPIRHPRPWDVNPIRVCAGALGPDRPHRDLILSPDHALYVDDVLMRARDLVNGATIVQEPAEEITYHHIELDRHDVIVAEGAAVESFLDTGNRAAFDNGGPAVAAHPNFARDLWASKACAPLVLRGPHLDATRAALIARARYIGWMLTEDPDLRLHAGGRTVHPARFGNTWAFDLPAGVDLVSLESRTAVPAQVDPASNDTRALGIPVTWLSLDRRPAPLEGASFGQGWFAPERGLRWTGGAGALHVTGARRLSLGTAGGLLQYWIGPGEDDAAVLAMCVA